MGMAQSCGIAGVTGGGCGVGLCVSLRRRAGRLMEFIKARKCLKLNTLKRTLKSAEPKVFRAESFYSAFNA